MGHSDIAPERKRDPGEKFPWKNLAKFKLAKWHTLNEKKIKKFRLIKLNNIEESQFLKNLYRIGYNEIKRSKLNYENKNLFKGFLAYFRNVI